MKKCKRCWKPYMQCRCGHYWCAGYWMACPRCHGDGKENILEPRECYRKTKAEIENSIPQEHPLDDPNWVHPHDCGYTVTGHPHNCDCRRDGANDQAHT